MGSYYRWPVTTSGRPASIHDVAREAGVSRSTVSRVLNDLDAAPEATRRRVVAAAEKLGYRPTAAARALRGGRWDMVALIVGDLAQPYFSSLAKAIEAAARRAGLSTMLIGVDRDVGRLEAALDSLEPLALSGLIIGVGRDLSERPLARHLERVQSTGTPVVVTSQRIERSTIPAVLADHEGAAYEATRALLDEGHHDIALAAGDASAPHVALLVEGFLAAFPPERRDEARRRIVHAPFEIPATTAAVRELLATTTPDAWVAAATYPALGVAVAYDGEAPLIACCESVPILDTMPARFRTYGPDWRQYADAVVGAITGPADRPAPLVQVIATHRRS